MAEDDIDITDRLSSALDMTHELKRSTDALGRSISIAFARGAVEGKRFEDVLRAIGQRMIAFGLRAAFKPIETPLQNLFGSLLSGNPFAGAGASLNVTPSARGNAFNLGAVTPFASGGVIAAPTYFPMRGGLGLMGERGAEAVMPLARGSDGRLGVRSTSAGAPLSITMNIATQDADSFRRSETQITGALARAVARGRRAI